MLVQVLAEFADSHLQDAMSDVAWETKPVPCMLEIASDGSFLGVVPTTHEETRGKRSVTLANPMAVPRSPVNRNSGHHPLIGTDDIGYVLGPGPWTKTAVEREKQEAHHEAFVRLIGRAATETNDPALQACVEFYNQPDQVEKARDVLREAKAGILVALSAGGPLIKRDAVQAFWRRHYRAAYDQRVESKSGVKRNKSKAGHAPDPILEDKAGANVFECLLSGTVGRIAPTHEAVKGLGNLGGQSKGVALMSFDKESFRSYGWEQNQNSPVSPDRAMAYVLALNHLLKFDNGHRHDVASVGFIYWLRNAEPFDWYSLLDAADPSQVEALLRFDPGADPNPNQFYMAGLSGNGGRLRVRYWVTDSVNHVKANLKGWHQQLRVQYPWDAAPVRLWQVLYAIHREGKPPYHQVLALIRRGIEGETQPLRYSVLAATLNRLRHAELDKLDRLRIPVGLVRMCLNDLFRQKGKKEMSEGLDPTCAISAYVCGRLMAEYENLQRTSSGGVNSSVLDRYFSLASTYPAAAFPKIEDLGLKHLRKLRRDRPSAATAIDRRLLDLHQLLAAKSPYPSRLSLEDQGVFFVGYYHQKAWSIAQIEARKQARTASTITEETGTNEETA